MKLNMVLAGASVSITFNLAGTLTALGSAREVYRSSFLKLAHPEISFDFLQAPLNDSVYHFEPSRKKCISYDKVGTGGVLSDLFEDTWQM